MQAVGCSQCWRRNTEHTAQWFCAKHRYQRCARGVRGDDATLAVLTDQLARVQWPAADEAGGVYGIDTDTDSTALAARCADLASKLAENSATPRQTNGVSAAPAAV
jgi:hypothetical protein